MSAASPGKGSQRPIKRLLFWIAGVFFQAGLIGLTVLLVWAFTSRSMPALKIWHTNFLSQEFIAGDANSQTTLQDYLDQEDRLFLELKETIYDQVKTTEGLKFCRYRDGGPQDPESFKTRWNRTFELVPDHIKGGVLLLHGLTDSPYSLSRIGEIFHAKGFYVLGLRLPGHGTIPSALTTVHWEDWVAASRIGAGHVRERIKPDQPFVIAGYSNGGALAVKYSLDALSDPTLPAPDQLLLFSPEIGVPEVAFIANAHKLFSFLPFFEKSKWLSIEPEYDPFKYNSFPKNAAQQAYEMTKMLKNGIEDARTAGNFADFPPVLTFLSWIDATVNTSATLHRLYGQLENKGSELVVFDMNRSDTLEAFIPAAKREQLLLLEANAKLPYGLTVITNADRKNPGMIQRSKASGSSKTDATPLPFSWPPGVYSLTHVAVPFSPDDPVYGGNKIVGSFYHGIPLGRLEPRGETHLLTAPLDKLMRLRYNPFFGYLEQRIGMEIDQTFFKDKNGEAKED